MAKRAMFDTFDIEKNTTQTQPALVKNNETIFLFKQN